MKARTRTGSRNAMFFRMLMRATMVKPGRVISALVAVVVAASVTTAMMNLYVDVQAKLRKEFRSYGANVVVAAFIVYLGDQLGVGSQLSTGVVVVQAPFDARFAQESVKNDAGANVEETAGIFVTTADLCDQARLVQMLKTAAKFDHTLNPTKTPGPGVTTAPSPTPCLGG